MPSGKTTPATAAWSMWSPACGSSSSAGLTSAPARNYPSTRTEFAGSEPSPGCGSIAAPCSPTITAGPWRRWSRASRRRSTRRSSIGSPPRGKGRARPAGNCTAGAGAVQQLPEEPGRPFPQGYLAMLAKLKTFALVGIDAVPVEVEVDASAGLPKTVLVGLPELAVRESIHRIERALANLGYQRPAGRTVINLAPADLRKDAGGFDLPIALGMLVATGQLAAEPLDEWALVGELALDGSVRPVKGALSMAMAAAARGIPKLLAPAANAREAAVVKSVAVYGIGGLAEAVGVLSGQVPAEPVVAGVEELFAQLNTYAEDFS